MNLAVAGGNFISLYYTLIKAVQVYDVRNDVVQSAAQKLLEVMTSLFATLPVLEIVRYRDYVFFNKERMRFEIERYASLQFIDSRLKALKLKSLTFLPGMTQDELLKFSTIFKEEREPFLNQFNQAKFEHILIEEATKEEEMPDLLKDGEQVKRTYYKALKDTRNMMQNLWTRRPVDIKSARRIVYNLIESISQDEYGLLALTTLKNFDEYTFNHSLNVGILSLAVGLRLGLGKKSLSELGSAGLLHDIGKVEIPKELIYKVDLNDEDWEIIKRHSIFGVREIMKIRGMDEVGMVSMVVAFQHHWNCDGSGYPVRNKDESPILYARIVRICDAYDAMTSTRTYQPIAYLPHYALRVLWTYKKIWFDPILVKIFIQLVGIYPVGSCLEIDSGEIGLVIKQNPGYLDLPFIKIVADKNGQKVDGQTIDLSLEKNIKILRPVSPQTYNINTATYFA